jgi:hypothetical protein
MGTGRVAVSISEAEIEAAAKALQEMIGEEHTNRGCQHLAKVTLEAAERIRWQPIETAPKDGTYVLVSWKGNPAVNRLQFSRRVQEWVNEEGVGYAMPTHWQLLPSPLESK